MKVNKLDDTVVAHIAKLLQVALLTGTDIIDHMRMIRLTSHSQNEGILVLEEEYRKIFDSSIEVMVKNSEQSTSEERTLSE